MKRHNLTAGTIWEGDWLEAPLTLGYSLAIVDGPYGMKVADWDMMSMDELSAFYAPHFDRIGALCAGSASMYVWNTSAGWARLDPEIRARGWTLASLIVWDKGNTQAMKGVERARYWPNVIEVCGFYQREAWGAPSVAHAAGADDRNWIRPWLASEWEATGLLRRDADRAISKNGMAGHYFGASQWELPTWENYQKLATYASEHGIPRSRPYFVLDGVEQLRTQPDGLKKTWEHLRASWEHLRAEYDHLREEYEAARPVFDLEAGASNVWRHPQLQDRERLLGPDGETLHSCQKPLLFSEKIVLSSSRPSERVLVPFGGTCREAVIMEYLARTEPEKARRYDVCELNADGKDYVGAVLAQIRGEDVRPRAAGQVGLFG